MRYLVLSLCTLTVFAAAQHTVHSAEQTAHETVTATVEALRSNDYGAVISAVVGDLETAKADWDAARAEPADADDDEIMDMQLAMITNPEMTEIMVAQARAQASDLPSAADISEQLATLPMVLMMVTGGNPELANAPEVQFILSLLPDLQVWAQGTSFDDPDKVEAVVRTFLSGVQELGVRTSADIRGLEFEDFLTKVSQLSVTVKESLKVHDIDLDAFLESIEATPHSDDANALSLSFTMLGKPRSMTMPMVEQDGTYVPALMVAIQKMMAGAIGGPFEGGSDDDWDFDDE